MAPEDKMLQHFEYAVMLSIKHLGKEAFPAEIARHLNVLLKRDTAPAQVYMCISRLEKMGLISSAPYHNKNVQGRRPVAYRLKPAGTRSIRLTTDIMNKIMSMSDNDQYLS